MELGLAGKVALVTGSSRGIGKAIAMALAKEGANIIICGRDRQVLEGTLREFNNVTSHSENVMWSCDVRYPRAIQECFNYSDLLRRFDKLDVLVNNVGGPLSFGKFEDLSDNNWIDDWNFNFMSMVRFTREALPWLKKSGNGRIINISAVPARQPGWSIPQYAASKAAMLNLSKYLANDLAKYNILVNSICPNTLEGGLWDANVADRANREGISAQAAASLMAVEEFKKMPLQRMGTPEDVANLVAFLASDKAKHITGTVINVDGGTVRSAI